MPFASSPLDLTSPKPAGSWPEPGDPAPGNTVPCWRLPVFGCRAEGGAEEDAVVLDAGSELPAGENAIGGPEGGGVRSVPLELSRPPVFVPSDGDLCPRLRSGPEAAAAGPVRRRAAILSGSSTTRMIFVPSVRTLYGCSESRSTTR